MQDDRASLLQRAMDKGGLSQMDMANGAQVSQSTVSRALAGRHQRRRSKTQERLFNYAVEILQRSDEGVQGELAKRAILAAVEGVWDGSAAHAKALARIIKALDGLRPQNTD